MSNLTRDANDQLSPHFCFSFLLALPFHRPSLLRLLYLQLGEQRDKPDVETSFFLLLFKVQIYSLIGHHSKLRCSLLIQKKSTFLKFITLKEYWQISLDKKCQQLESTVFMNRASQAGYSQVIWVTNGPTDQSTYVKFVAEKSIEHCCLKCLNNVNP